MKNIEKYLLLSDVTIPPEELKEYVTGRKIIKNDNELGLLMLAIDKMPCDFPDEDVFELYERYENKELTRKEMSFHLLLLYNLSIQIVAKDKESISVPKQQLVNLLNDSDYYYLESPLPLEIINKIKIFFVEAVAVC